MELISLKLSVTNCYLFKNKNKYVLVDTGYEYDWELFCKKLKEAGVGFNDISHIILTHHHDDHSGLLNKIIEKNSDIRVVMHSLTKDLLLKGENDHSHGGGMLNKRVKFLISFKRIKIMLVLGKSIDKNRNLKFPPYIARENDIIISGECRLKDTGIESDGTIIETPGHTVDSISVIFDDGTCIVGDAAANMLKVAGTKNCVIFIYDMNKYYKSWEKILSKNAKQIFPAHGKPFSAEKLKKNIWKNKAENIVITK